MQDASAADFQGAIGAALAANDKTQAEAWLRQALERFPNDASILAMAARFEQARGDNQRAADYWRASIAAMPASSPTDRLAHDLAYPDVSNKSHTARTAADLQQLLNPDNEPFPRTTKLPPLPAYGPDPYNGRPPVVLNQPQPTPQQVPMITAPATTEVPIPAPPATRSISTPSPAPMARAPSPPVGNENAQANPPATKRSKASSGSTRSRASSPPPAYSGKMNLPPSDQSITTTGTPPANQNPSRQAPVYIPSTFRDSSRFANPFAACFHAATAAIVRDSSGFGPASTTSHHIPADGPQGGPGAGSLCRPD